MEGGETPVYSIATEDVACFFPEREVWVVVVEDAEGELGRTLPSFEFIFLVGDGEVNGELVFFLIASREAQKLPVGSVWLVRVGGGGCRGQTKRGEQGEKTYQLYPASSKMGEYCLPSMWVKPSMFHWAREDKDYE